METLNEVFIVDIFFKAFIYLNFHALAPTAQYVSFSLTYLA